MFTSMATNYRNYPNTGSTLLEVKLADALKMKIQTGVKLIAYIRLSGRYMRCSQLGGELRRSFGLQSFVKVRDHGKGWYSAKFSSQGDYDQAFRARRWRIFGRYTIQVYRWEPNFQFGEVPPLRAGDIVEGLVEGLPIEHWRDEVVTEIASAVCQPLDCRAPMVDSSSEGKLPRFWFEFNGFQLPLQIQIDGGPVVGLSYSRAKQCYNCHGYGHISWSCPKSNPEPRQWTRSANSATPSSSGSGQTQVRGISSDLPPLPSFPNEIGAGSLTGSHQGTPEQMIPPELHEETSPVGPIPVLNGIPSSSGITNPLRILVEKNMPAKGAMIVEKGEERIPTLYTLAEEVSGIDVNVKVTHLNVQNGNRRQLTINPYIGVAPKYTKRVLCTSIDGADATLTLEEMCHNKGASLVVVLDKSSVLDDQIGTRLGFSAFHRAEMTFQRFVADGPALDVKVNCLLLWKREEVCVDVSAVDKGLSSQHLKFKASWVIESDEEEPDGLSHRVANFAVEGPSDFSDFTTFGSGRGSDSEGSSSSSTSVVEGSSNYSDSTSDGSDSDGSSSYPTAPEELSSESGNVPPIPTPHSDIYGDTSSLFHICGEEHSYETSTSSSSRSESSYSGPAVFDESPPHSPDSDTLSSNYGDADAEGSSGDEMPYEPDWEDHFTDAEEISVESSAPSTSSSSEEGNSPGSITTSVVEVLSNPSDSARSGSINDSEGWSSYSADSTTSGSADDNFSPRYEDNTDSEASTQYHSAAEELSDESSFTDAEQLQTDPPL